MKDKIVENDQKQIIINFSDDAIENYTKFTELINVFYSEAYKQKQDIIADLKLEIQNQIIEIQKTRNPEMTYLNDEQRKLINTLAELCYFVCYKDSAI